MSTVTPRRVDTLAESESRRALFWLEKLEVSLNFRNLYSGASRSLLKGNVPFTFVGFRGHFDCLSCLDGVCRDGRRRGRYVEESVVSPAIYRSEEY